MPSPANGQAPARFVLHALWSATQNRLMLWAEDAAALRLHAAGHPTGYGRGRDPLAHPFALQDAGIIAHWLHTDRGHTAHARIRLPSSTGRPVASPELTELLNRPTGLSGIRTWTVSVYTIQRADLVRLLEECCAQRTFRAGATVHFFAELAAAAAAVVRAGNVLPGITGQLTPRASWHPAPDPSVDRYLDAMADVMPHLARAEAGRHAPDPRQVTDRFFHAAVDSHARQLLADADWQQICGDRRLPQRPGSTWVRALGRADSRLPATGRYTAMADTLALWAQPPEISHAISVQLRLHPPHEPDPHTPITPGTVTAIPAAGLWTVDATLVSEEDTVHTLPAAALISDPERTRKFEHAIGRPAADTLKKILTDAADVCPPLAPLAHAPAAGGTDVSFEQLSALFSAVDELRSRRCELIVPEELRAPAKLSAKLRLTGEERTSSGIITLDSLTSFSWELSADQQPLDLAALEQLAETPVPVIRTAGRWVRLDRQELLRLLSFFRSRAQAGVADPLSALRLAAESDMPEVSGRVSVEIRGWLNDFLASDTEQRLEPLNDPAGFNGRLWDVQREGLSWLWFLDRLGFGACLADEMGIGKTPQTIALLLTEREKLTRSPGPTLLIMPMSCVSNWEEELARFAPSLRVHVHHGADRPDEHRMRVIAADHDVVLTTYGLALDDLHVLQAARWHRVVLDEAQHIKNMNAQQTRAINQIPAPRRVALSGTPIENRLSELWSIFNFINPGLLGTWPEFKDRFVIPVEQHGSEEAARTLRQLIAPFILRRLKTDPRIKKHLPEKIEKVQPVPLSAEQVRLYTRIVERGLAEIATAPPRKRRGLILKLITRLKQVCNHPLLILKDGTRFAGRSGKVAHIENQLMNVIGSGRKMLIFTQYAEFGEPLAEHLARAFGRRVEFFHGGLTAARRRKLRAEFHTDPEFVCMIVSLKAGGAGLNLVAASHVIHADRWWNPAVEDQATDRAYRGGQNQDVYVEKLVCRGTFEDRIDELISSKRELADMIVGVSGNDNAMGFTEMSVAELRDAVSLSAAALTERWDAEEIAA